MDNMDLSNNVVSLRQSSGNPTLVKSIPIKSFDAAASINQLSKQPIQSLNKAKNSDTDNLILQKIFKANPGLNTFSKPDDYLIQDARGQMKDILKKNNFGLEFQNKGETQYQVGNDKMQLDNPDKHRLYINTDRVTPQGREEAIRLDILSHALHNNPEYSNFTKDLEQKLTSQYGKKMLEGNGGADAYVRGYLSNSKEYQPYKDEMKFLPQGYFKTLDNILKNAPK